jgi:energy-converting hydrogenase Eha subunit F
MKNTSNKKLIVRIFCFFLAAVMLLGVAALLISLLGTI